MSALAKILLEENEMVSGSDLISSLITEELKKRGAKIYIGHDPKNVPEEASIIYSTEIPVKDNPEFQHGIKHHLPVMHRSDLLAELMKKKKSIAIAGTHGKTTTTSLAAAVFTECGLSPTYAVGGTIKQYGTNARSGSGEYFIAEADESDGTFLKYNPHGAIITNIGQDHMDYFGTKERLKDAFSKFFFKVQSHDHLFWCKDNKYLRELNPHGISYGFSEDAALRGSNFCQDGWNLSLDIHYKAKTHKNVFIPLVGFHNALNALSVFGLGLECGIDEQQLRKAFLAFKGVKRRADVIAEKEGVLFIDDYAHHPTEISSTLYGLRSILEEKRLVVVYQPHRYTRVKGCLGHFGKVFDHADEVIITDIYSSGETPIKGIDSQCIIDEVLTESEIRPLFVAQSQLESRLNNFLKSGDAVIFMGAGDISLFGRKYAGAFSLGKEALTV